MTSYICHECGVEHDTVPAALYCAQSHLAQAAETLKNAKNVVAAEKDPGEGGLPPEVTTPPAEEPMPLPEAPELLGRAARHMHDRAATYDTLGGERSMGKAVRAFNAITGRELTEAEGWLLLQVLKDVRNFSRVKPHQDSLEDCIAYSALKAEAEMRRLREWEGQQKT